MPRSALETLHRICHIGQTDVGLAYMKQLALNMAREFQVRYVLIGRPVGDGQSVRTLVAVDGERILDDFDYDLAGTPCDDVLSSDRVCAYTQGVAEAFPDDQLLATLNAEAYIGASILDPKGSLIGLVVLLHDAPLDATERLITMLEFLAARIGLEIHREEAEARRREEAEIHLQRQRLESLGQLASGVAHDFNNVLGAILGHAELLELKIGDNPSMATNLEAILSSTQVARDITQQLLDFSRPSSDRRDVDGQVNRELRLVEDLVMHTTHHRVQLHVETGADADRVTLSQSKLQQVLMNLAINARDAMPDGGRMWLSSRTVHLPVAGQDHEAPFVEIRVRDEGHGIPQEYLTKIFDPFFTTKLSGKGTGLGLATVYGLVSSGGGTITVDSSPEGTEFVIQLPVVAPPTEATPTPRPDRSEAEARGSSADSRILIIEDNLPIVNLLQQLLALLGHESLVATTGRGALDTYRASKANVNLIISDMNLPDMDGALVLEEIMRDDPELPMVLTSGDPATVEASGLADRPNVAVLPKPYGVDALRTCLNSFLVR